MISLRYSLPTLILLTIALVPTIIHNYLGATTNDGKSVKEIAETLNDFISSPTNRNKSWGIDVFDSKDWIERTYTNQQAQIRFFAARSFDHKRLYHHPELALSYGHSLKSAGIIQISQNPEIYAHLLKNSSRGLVAYVLLFEDKSVKNPILHQITQSLKLLVSSRKAMTLFYVSDPSNTENTDFKTSSAANILKATIQSFIAQQ